MGCYLEIERWTEAVVIYLKYCPFTDPLYGLAIRVPGYRSREPGLIPGITRFS
jgi:hypothetical protein